jgi:iron(III) transport system substrate-binding protein
MTSIAKFLPLAAVVLLAGTPAVGAADLPAPTKKILKSLSLPESTLAGLDKELAVPAPILEGAKKEGTVTILGSWRPREFSRLSGPFKRRYPFLKVNYNYGRAFNARAIKPIIAYKEGRYIADAVTGFGGSRRLYKEASALEDLRDLPGFKNALDGNDPEGGWMAIRLRFWCMAYNTDKVKKADLPKTWDDILTNARWHDAKIGVGNRPQLWLLMLRKAKGKAWTDAYVDKFFTVVRPQFRKEGLNALVTLVVAGEVDAAIPAGPSRVERYAKKGAPVGWHCPGPIPRAFSRTAVLKGAPHRNAAKLWVNWLVSKEGQVAQYYAEGTAPSHKDLQMAKLLTYSEQVYGREQVSEDVSQLRDLKKVWGRYWQNAPKKGEGRKKRKK